MNTIGKVLIIVFIVLLLIVIIYSVLKSPFKYPYHTVKFDISGKRSPNIDDLIDNYLNKKGLSEFENHFNVVERWKKECQERINNSFLRHYRQKQFNEIIDDNCMFCFVLIRKQTRYKQNNYIKTPYTVYITVSSCSYCLKKLKERYNNLSKINFECTLSEYFSKDQRRLMTKELRDQIIKRDNYTCQMCGKYMPDCVGLHVDHIIPIKKGGKSIPSNLQVLCSKCNGQKSDK